MGYKNRQTGRGPRRGGDRRGNRRFNNRGGRNQDNQQGGQNRIHKGSRDFNRRSDRGGDRANRGHNRQRDPNGSRRIARGNRRDEQKKPRDLDGQLMNYWIKSGKGQDQEGKNLAQQKLNEEMENYWKQKEGEMIQQKPKP